ncbi:hypothetical protein EJ08DRAFT_139648 [Tothia fuscella]|uniref:Uncharacterized protein n=1 Tax=Tothia fuscella TaxID=1048955 RepID=A0A9P4TZ92_9PEZI|nr:hypothetical protein EJ08DRAFT_139648 [Tothia fuscella]
MNSSSEALDQSGLTLSGAPVENLQKNLFVFPLLLFFFNSFGTLIIVGGRGHLLLPCHPLHRVLDYAKCENIIAGAAEGASTKGLLTTYLFLTNDFTSHIHTPSSWVFGPAILAIKANKDRSNACIFI